MGTQNLVSYVREGKWVEKDTPETEKEKQGVKKLIAICNMVFEVYKKTGGNSFKDARDYIVATLGEARYPEAGVPAYITNQMYTDALQTTMKQQELKIEKLNGEVEDLRDLVRRLAERIQALEEHIAM